MRCPYCGNPNLELISQVENDIVPLDCEEGWVGLYYCDECDQEMTI